MTDTASLVITEYFKTQNVAIIPESANNKTFGTDASFISKVSRDTSLYRAFFPFGIPFQNWLEQVDGVDQLSFTNATASDGIMNLVSGATGVKNVLRSYRHIRGTSMTFVAKFPNPSAAAERTIGVFTKDSGYGIRVRGGVSYFFYRSVTAGVPFDTEEVISINASTLSSLTTYDIQYQLDGGGQYYIFLNQSLISTSAPALFNGEYIYNTSLPISFECINQGEAAQIDLLSFDVRSRGFENVKTYGAIGTSTRSGSVSIKGTNIPVLVIRNKSLVGTLSNTIDMAILRIRAYSDRNCVIRVWVTRFAGAITLNDQVWKDFRDGRIEYIEYDNPNVANPMTFNPAFSQLSSSARISQDSTISIETYFDNETSLYHTPGDIIIITMHRETGGATLVGSVYEFSENV
jgi:hypothetical protein